MAKKKPERDTPHFRAQTQRLDMIFGYLSQVYRVTIAGGVVAYLIYAVDNYLTHDADNLSAAASVIKAFDLPYLVGILAFGVLGGAYMRERRGKQRAIRKKGELQRTLEAGEPNRTSSGLTEIGTTPDEDC